MKAKIYILTALLAVNLSLLSEGNPEISIMKDNSKADNISLHRIELVPVTPGEAFFSDAEPRPVSEISRLTPITLKEATFEEGTEEISIPIISPLVLQKIAPETPKEAEFEEIANEPEKGIESFAPVAPLTASFEE